MAVEERTVYTFICNGCELREEMDNDLLPQDWYTNYEFGPLHSARRHFCPSCASEMDERDPDGDKEEYGADLGSD